MKVFISWWVLGLAAMLARGQTLSIERGPGGGGVLVWQSPVAGIFAVNVSTNLIDWSMDVAFQSPPGSEGKRVRYDLARRERSFYRWRFLPYPRFIEPPSAVSVKEGEPLVIESGVLSENVEGLRWWHSAEGEGWGARCCFTNGVFSVPRAEAWMTGFWKLGGNAGGALIFSQVCAVTVGPAERPPVSLDEAPVSIAGKRFLLSISRGTPPFASFGSYSFVTANMGNEFWVESTLFSSTGTYSYSKTAPLTAVITFSDSLVGDGLSQVLNFKSPTHGDFRLEKFGALGYQEGSFRMAE